MSKFSTTVTAVTVVTLTATLSTGTAVAQSGYHVFRTGIGIYPRTTPTLDPAARTGTPLGDGTPLSIVCQPLGEQVGGNPIHNRLTDGAYVPDYFTNTGVDGVDAQAAPLREPRHHVGERVRQTGHGRTRAVRRAVRGHDRARPAR